MRAAATSAARSRTRTSASRSSTRRRIRRCSPAGACGRATGRSAPRCSSRLLPRVSVEVGYYRRWLENFVVTDNLTLNAAATSTRSRSPRRSIRGCPTAAATRFPGPLYNVNPSVASSAVNNFVTLANQLRRPDAEVELDLAQHQRAAEKRPGAPGRVQHRANLERLLRDAGGAAGVDRHRRRARPTRTATRTPGSSRGSRRSGRTRCPRWTCRSPGR